jgi:hypothetical protein
MLEGALDLNGFGLGPGEHSVFATAIDAAGNRTYLGPRLFRVPAPPAAIVAPSPPAGSVVLDGPIRRAIKYQSVRLSGIVRDTEGFPIARAKVAVATRTVGAGWRALTTTTTDAKGHFIVTLPKGPSREVRVSYLDSAQTAEVVVPAPLRLTTDRKQTRNGRSITFQGSVAEAGTASTRVTLQAWARGKWTPFKSVALKNGKFRARYRFSGTYRTTRYRFRAVTASDPGFLFAAGRSTPVTVLVRPGGAGR